MTKEEINRHKIAAKKLYLIVEKAFKFIKRNIGRVSEYDVNKFIISEFKKQNLLADKKHPIQIVAVNQHSATAHYFPYKRRPAKIQENNLILIDTWAKLKGKNSPFADITWIGYSGKKVPKDIKRIFIKVIKARDNALAFIRRNLKNRNFPKTKAIDKSARDYFKKFRLEKYFLHGLGHSLGFRECHGRYFYLRKKSQATLKPNIPFTIEPGLYFKNKFGIRSEIDCYVAEDYKLIITTEVQNKIIKI